jgi:hypothetical protein
MSNKLESIISGILAQKVDLGALAYVIEPCSDNSEKLSFDDFCLDDYIAAVFGLYAHSAALNLGSRFSKRT